MKDIIISNCSACGQDISVHISNLAYMRANSKSALSCSHCNSHIDVTPLLHSLYGSSMSLPTASGHAESAKSIQDIPKALTAGVSEMRDKSNSAQRWAAALIVPIIILLATFGIMTLIEDVNPLSLDESWIGWVFAIVVVLLVEWKWLES
jgi:hypothetical protein